MVAGHWSVGRMSRSDLRIGGEILPIQAQAGRVGMSRIRNRVGLLSFLVACGFRELRQANHHDGRTSRTKKGRDALR
jgi:hypothetical protein